jgi:hypothetical protein
VVEFTEEDILGKAGKRERVGCEKLFDVGGRCVCLMGDFPVPL